MKYLSALVAATALLARRAFADDCANGPWQKGIMSIGGPGGDPFCETRFKQGYFIKGIEAWANHEVVRGLRFTYSDDSQSQLWGTADSDQDDRHANLQWDMTKDRVDSLTLWGNGKGTRLGRIQLTLASGAKLDVGKDTKKQKAYVQDRGSGVLVGAYGGHGADINALGLLFLGDKVDHIEITDMKFDDDLATLNSKNQGISQSVLAEQWFTNLRKDTNDTWHFGGKITKQVSTTFSQSSSKTFGVDTSITISAEVMGMGASRSLGFKWETTHTSTSEASESHGADLTWSSDPVIRPGKSVHCTAYAAEGNFNGAYSSKVSMTLKDGRKFDFTERGRLESVSWSTAVSSCEDIDTSKVPVGPNSYHNKRNIVSERRVKRGSLGV